jgi:type I restriction enzyme, R subunit
VDELGEWGATEDSPPPRARNNDFQNFRLVFDRTFLDTVVKRMDENDDIFRRILDDDATRQTVLDHYAERLYGRLRAEHDQLGMTPAVE